MRLARRCRLPALRLARGAVPSAAQPVARRFFRGRREHEVRGVPESRRFRLQGDGGEEPGRDPERFGEGVDGGLARLEVDREHSGGRAGREPAFARCRTRPSPSGAPETLQSAAVPITAPVDEAGLFPVQRAIRPPKSMTV